MKLINTRFRSSLSIVSLVVTLFATANLATFAKESELNYLKPNQPAAAALLAPPPILGSAEQNADLETVRNVYHAATSNDLAAAYSEKKFSVFNFTGSVGSYFVEANLPKTAAFFAQIQEDAATVTDLGKDYFKRPRPYTTDTNLVNGKLEKSFSYPSGHSTETMVLGLVLAEIIPTQHDAILAHARTMGWHRVQIARHYPTDIYAGRVLAQAIVAELNKNPAFEKQLAEVKTEIETARTAAQNH